MTENEKMKHAKPGLQDPERNTLSVQRQPVAETMIVSSMVKCKTKVM